MNGPVTKQITITCQDESVYVSYANSSINVAPPKVTVCHGYNVSFHFAGPPGTADIIPDDPANDPWLKKTGIPVPSLGQPTVVDTTASKPNVDHEYTIKITAQEPDNAPFTIEIDPIIRPV